tara:strand:- start:1408 stop:1881 length:474 start_codon:yes stop_codon:yes gene_type:complete
MITGKSPKECSEGIAHRFQVRQKHYHAFFLLFSVVETIYFIVVITLWFKLIQYNPQLLEWEYLSNDLLKQLGPVIILFLLSSYCIYANLKSQKNASKLTIYVFFLSVCLFFFDVTFKRSQIHHFIAPQEYVEKDGREHIYLNWWWYHDHGYHKKKKQ